MYIGHTSPYDIDFSDTEIIENGKPIDLEAFRSEVKKIPKAYNMKLDIRSLGLCKPSIDFLLKWAKNLSLLFRAVYEGELEKVKTVLQSDKGKILIKERDCCYLPLGRPRRPVPELSALLFAAALGYADIVEWLLKEGWSTYAEKNGYGGTALMLAAEQGHASVVKYLLTSGTAEADEKTEDGHTVLLVAVHGEHLDMVEWLVTSESKVNMLDKDSEGRTAWLIAAFRNCSDIMECLFKTGEVNLQDRDPDGNTALLLAAGNHSLKVVLWLLEQRLADIHERNLAGMTPLLMAANSGSVEMVQLLLERKANIRDSDSLGRAALSIAVIESDNDRLVPWLLQTGNATIDEKDKNGHTILDLLKKEPAPNIDLWFRLIGEHGFELKPLLEHDVLSETGIEIAKKFASFYVIRKTLTDGILPSSLLPIILDYAKTIYYRDEEELVGPYQVLTENVRHSAASGPLTPLLVGQKQDEEPVPQQEDGPRCCTML